MTEPGGLLQRRAPAGICLALALLAGCYADPAVTGALQREGEVPPPVSAANRPKPEDEPASCRLKTEPRPLIAGKHRPPAVPLPARPAKGEWYADPVYGSCVVRLTDHEHEPPEGFARNDYSRRQAFNADDTRILVYARNGYWHLYDADTLEHVKALDLGGGGVEPHWHPRDPELLYVVPNNGGMSLHVYNTRTGNRSEVADFTDGLEIPGMPDADSLRDIWPDAARVWTKSEGSPSMDARFWAFQVETEDFSPLGLIGYDAREHRITGIYDFRTDGDGIGRPDHVSMSPKGNYIVASWNGSEVDCPSRFRLGTLDEPCGLMAFTRTFDKAVGLAARGPHSDIAIDSSGKEVIVISNYISGDVEMIALDDGDVTPLWKIYENGYSTAMHVSGKAYEKPGWVLIS
ncbi:MAG TPA: hypothetical protein VF267_06970, partial [Gammaproteobacteria bacterium]